jgi:hypothetical protein
MALKFLNNGYFAGKVGIGTESPNQLLELKKTSGTVTARLHADHDSSPATGIEFMRGLSDTWGGDAYTDWKIGSGSSSDADFAITSKDTTRGENERVTIEYDTGNVGIGTSSPNQKLQVGGNLHVYDEEGDTDAAIFISTGTSNVTTVSIRSNGISYLNGGNVGIGTTSPGVPLDVTGVIRTTTSFVGNASIVNQVTAATSSGSIKFKNHSGVDRAIITDAGNVGIGTTSPRLCFTYQARHLLFTLKILMLLIHTILQEFQMLEAF